MEALAPPEAVPDSSIAVTRLCPASCRRQSVWLGTADLSNRRNSFLTGVGLSHSKSEFRPVLAGA